MAFKDKFKTFQSLQTGTDIVLRQVNPETDLSAYFDIYSDAGAFIYYEGYGNAPDMEHVKIILHNQIRDFEKARMYCWTIADSKTETVMGRIHLSDFENGNSCANIGYFLGREYWGKGVISICIAPVIRFGFDFLELERICTRVEVNNIASWKALEKNGFLREGTLRRTFQLSIGLHDCYIYAKLSTD